MLFGPELLLMAVAAGLYVYDSALLLYSNEGILTLKGARDWRVSFGSNQIRLMGKEVFVPNPLFPHRPQFRLLWDTQRKPGKIDAGWEARRALFKPLLPMTWGMTLALFVLLPLGFFTRLGEPMLIAAIGVLYLNIIAVLVLLGIRRSRYGLSGKRFVVLAFESLVCSPLALNLVRKVSAGIPIHEDLVTIAGELQSPANWNASRIAIITRLDEELDLEDEHSERAVALRRFRDGLLANDMPCPQ